MIIDGRAIAKDILDSVKAQIDEASFSAAPTMTAVTCSPNFETQKYLEMKKRKAAEVGISLNIIDLSEHSTTEEVISCVKKISTESDGVVVQLPLPGHINKEAVLKSVSPEKDPDGFCYSEKHQSILPPVVGAIDEISKVNQVEWKNKKVVILGQGSLVGLPAARYARKRGARVRVYEKGTLDISSLKTAEIIVSGIGQPNFITKDMVHEGVIIFDAGTSEEDGVLAGDVHPEVSEVASLITPVPGGIGPITIAYLLRNLLSLKRQ